MARAIEERIRKRKAVIEAVRSFGVEVSRTLGPATVILHGSYARGDFNLWSDVDILVVVGDDVELPDKPYKRLDLILDLLRPGFEVRVLRASELRRALARNPAARRALEGALIVLDMLGLAKELLRHGAKLA